MAEKICDSKCPYKGRCDDGGYYYSRAIEEAIELLKAQEPRVLALDEIRERKELSCWLEWRDGDFYAALLSVTDDTKVDYVKFWSACAFMQNEYGITVRCWSAKPTEEQRKAVAWSD